MKLFRLLSMCVAAATTLAGAHAQPARSDDFPNRQVRIVVPFPPGGPADLSARAVAAGLSQELGQPVVVENKPGAGAVIAAETVLGQPADGYTLMLASDVVATGKWLYSRRPYDTLRDFRGVIQIFQSPHMVVVSPGFSGDGIADLVAMARRDPQAVTYASAAAGTMPHLATELFKQATGTQMTHVPYKGSAPALVAVMGGEVTVYFDIQFSAQALLKSGKLKTLGVTADRRSPQFPDVPTLAEQGIEGVEAWSKFGLVVRNGTPDAVVARLNAAINAVMATPAFVAQIDKLGATPVGGTAAAYQKVLEQDTERWGKVIREAGIRLD